MSNPESFIDEVTEEIRRDRLFGLMRRYGWIGIVVVLGIVGGAAYVEWSKARAAADAEAFGDRVLAAQDEPDATARQAELAEIVARGPQVGIVGLLQAANPAGDRAGTLAALEAVGADASLSPAYRDLAVLRRVILAAADLPLADRRTALTEISAPGRPYRALALEQIAYLDVEAGNAEAALAGLGALTQDQEATPTLRRRAEQMIVALGGTPVAPAPAADPALEQEG